MISSTIGSKMRRRPLIGAALVGLACLGLAACDEQKQQAENGAPKGKYEVGVIKLEPQTVAITAELPGRTAASLVAEVRPQVGGIILKRLFKEGSEVQEGDVLYQIDPASYQATFDSAKAALQNAEAAVPSAQSKYDRYENLVKQDAVAKQDYDDALSSLLQAKAEVAAQKANVETARINLDYTKVKAAISGRVDASTVTVGALVTADQTSALTTIRTLDPINVDVIQSSTNLLRLERAVKEGRVKTSGDNVAVKLRLEDGSIYDMNGSLEFRESVIDETTGTFTVRLQFPNPDHLLLPGMYVRGIIEEGVAEGSFLVPQSLVEHTPEGAATAKFVNKDGKVDVRTLSVQRSVGNNWLVDGGISAGDLLIVEGTSKVAAGQEVKTRMVDAAEINSLGSSGAAATDDGSAAAANKN
ncbi:membrane fusion protein (multidrug efflux system) [Breoghania corrubedonensis]|uniref:Membrane fusion protein (Multidrug efflux system) n=2 Tax=Breoghania corrubedonensis TaxID=665038 RepID=A0A2T5V9N9_9HYPH|nr:membrane fusion protein (multidrug efflux system) [Breoghania corrubedonensis]